MYATLSPSLLSKPSASIQRMVPRQAAVPWIRRRVLGWCSTHLSPRASAGSPSSTAPIPTTTHRPKPCHATPPSTVRGKHEAIILDLSCSTLKLKTCSVPSTNTTVTAHYPNQRSIGCSCNYAVIMLMKS